MIISIVDVETTGLDPELHEIIEIGMVVFDSKTFEIINTVEVKVKPERPEDGAPEAYKVNGYNEEEWAEAGTLEQAMGILRAAGSGSVFCAQNMIFDWEFLKAAAVKTGIPLPFMRMRLDLVSIAYARHHRDISKFNLKALCEFLGVEPEPDMHRALAGAMAEYHCFRRMLQ